MEHTRVDRIIEQVKKSYQGDFSVNSDWQYSQRLTKRYHERSKKHFNGKNGKFGLDRMLCTENCVREGDALRVPTGGVVYGPYFAFAAGDYYAWFEISGDLCGCMIEVSSSKCGIMALAEASGIEKNEQIMLPFSLTERVDDLELKVLNRGNGMVCFKSVTVKDQPEENMGIRETQIPQNSEFGHAGMGNLESALEDVETIQLELAKEARESGRISECTLPANSRFHGVKNLIRKVINCFVLFQVEFNRKIANCFATAVRELQAIVVTVRQLAFAVGELNEKIGVLCEQVEMQKQRLEDQKADRAEYMTQCQELIQKAEEHVAKVEAETEETNKRLTDLIREHVEQDRQIQQKVDQMLLCAAEDSQDREKRFEQLAKKIAELNESLEQKSACSEKDHAEIGSIWNKIREIDQEFRSVWQSSRDINSNLNSVWSTYHAFRQEVFYEIDIRSRQKGLLNGKQDIGQAALSPTVKSTAKAKIEQSGGKIRLNLGSGAHAVDEYLSVDVRELPGVDIVADVAALPYRSGTVDELFSSHLIEHFTATVMERELLPYWYSLLKSEGIFRVIFPDLDGMIQAYTKNEMSFEALAEVIMGGQDYQLDYHYTVYSPERVAEMLKRVGFRNVKIVARNRENGECREAEIVAQK